MSNEQIAKPLLIEIGGDDYEFTPLKIKDITGPVTDYFQMNIVAELMRQKDAFEPEIYDQLMKEVKEEAKEIQLGTTRFAEELVKPKNLFYMFWLSLRKKHPEVKKAQFDEMIQADEAAATILLENLGRIIAIYDSTPTEDADEEVKEEGTRTKKKGTKKKIAPST